MGRAGAPTRARQRREVLAAQQLHHQEVQLEVGVGAEVVDGDDVGVVEGGRGAGLALEARAQLLVQRRVGRARG